MTPKKVLLFAPCAFNLAETSRMVEIAKGIKHHPTAQPDLRHSLHFYTEASSNALIEKHAFR